MTITIVIININLTKKYTLMRQNYKYIININIIVTMIMINAAIKQLLLLLELSEWKISTFTEKKSLKKYKKNTSNEFVFFKRLNLINLY